MDEAQPKLTGRTRLVTLTNSILSQKKMMQSRRFYVPQVEL